MNLQEGACSAPVRRGRIGGAEFAEQPRSWSHLLSSWGFWHSKLDLPPNQIE